MPTLEDVFLNVATDEKKSTKDINIIKEMKRKTVEEILAESLHELTKKKTIDKITVREIVANCDYSVATF